MVRPCYEERRLGSNKNSYRIVCRIKKRKEKTKEEMVEYDGGGYEDCWCVCVEDIGDWTKWRFRMKVAN